VKVGLDNNSLYHLTSLNGIRVLEFARSLGLEGVQFVHLRQVSPQLDKGQLLEAQAHAKQHGQYLVVGVPSINPHRVDKNLLQDGDGDLAKGLRRHLELISDISLGSRTVRFFIAEPGDRPRGGLSSWQQEVDDTIAVAKSIAPILRDLDLKLAIENHTDISTREAVEIVSKIGPDVTGILLDFGNTMVTFEEPLAATKRVAPYAVATHLKDGILVFGDDGLILSPRPAGQGILPVAEMLQVLYAANPNIEFSIEDYGMLIPAEIYNEEYVLSFAETSTLELAQLVRLAWACEQSISEGNLESPAAVERVPWSVRAKQRLEQSAHFVNDLVDQLNFRS
jgi:sugar phosphate isomerase/epimerase